MWFVSSVCTRQYCEDLLPNIMENKITSFRQIKEIIEKVPPELFQVYFYGHVPGRYCGDKDNGKSCFLGHIHRYFDPTESRAEGDSEGYGARKLTKTMIEEVHHISLDGTHVNNTNGVNGYTEPVIKDRLMHMIEDGIKWELEKTN